MYLDRLTDLNKKDLKEFFARYLTSCEKNNLDSETVSWKQNFADVPLKQNPKTACDAAARVGSVCCERSFSALRRLKLWKRASMNEDRLSGLAKLMIYQDSQCILTPEDVFARKAKWGL